VENFNGFLGYPTISIITLTFIPIYVILIYKIRKGDNMKYLRLVILLVALCIVGCAILDMDNKHIPKQCWECPQNNPCTYTFYIECNTCTGDTWCEYGQWYTSGLSMCTAMACSGYGYKIENPFNKGE
jgi:hypothetical protein